MRTLISLFIFTFLSISSVQAQIVFPFVGKVTGDNVNVRAGTSTNFERIGKLSQNQNVIVLSEEYDWYQIRLDATMPVYIRADYLDTVQQGFGKVIGHKVNLRAKPDIHFSVMGKVVAGDVLKILGEQNGWYAVQAPEGISGWIHSQFIAFESNDVPEVEAIDLSDPVVPTPQWEAAKLEGQLQHLGDNTYTIQLSDGRWYAFTGPDTLKPWLGLTVKIDGQVLVSPEASSSITLQVQHLLLKY